MTIPDVHGMVPTQMVFPCLFFQMSNSECALCRYGLGKPVRDAIRNLLKSVIRGLKKVRTDFKPEKSPKLDELIQYVEDNFIIRGIDNVVEEVTCFGLIKIEYQFVCGLHDIWFRSNVQEITPFLTTSGEGAYGCLCYFEALIAGTSDKKLWESFSRFGGHPR